MSLQERTLVIKNFDPDKTTQALLKELCMQTGPIRKVVVKSDHAFVEYEDAESVGYSKAMLDGIQLFGRPLIFTPKLRHERYHKYTNSLHDYIAYDKQQQEINRMQEHQRQSMEQLKAFSDNQMQILTIPVPILPQEHQAHNMTMPADQMPRFPNQQSGFYEQNFTPQQQLAPQLNQTPTIYPHQFSQHQHQQMPPQQFGQPMFRDFQAPSENFRRQYVQPGPHMANPMRSAPDGRGYMPRPQRSRSFHNLNSYHHQQQQQRRLSDKAPNFPNRRR